MLLLLLAAALLTSPRQVIDLNEGWKFARVPKAPSVWQGADAVPTSAWKVISVDSQEAEQENGKALNAFDGDPKTIWHTEWSKKQTPYPHELIIDLGSRVDATGIRILPRQTSPQNGRPNHFELYLSNDATEWGKPILTDRVPNSSNLYQHAFPSTTAKFMRLEFLDGYKPEPFLSLSEIGLIKKVDLKNQKGYQSQYNIANVQVGDERFDLQGAALEAVKQQELAQLKPIVWQSATLPHAAWIRPLNKPEIWQGVTYYRRTLRRPANSNDKNLELTIEAAMQNSDVWLNGVRIAGRRGGYLPIVADISRLLKPVNDLLVRIDNSDNPLIPPGKPQQEMDFMYGNGLYRNAYLTVTNKLHISDPILENAVASGGIYVTYPSVTSTFATVRVRTHVRNSSDSVAAFTVSQILISPNGKTLTGPTAGAGVRQGFATQLVQDIPVAKPKLWSPDTPNLYKLVTRVKENGKVVDQVTTTIGIRKVEVSRKEGLVLNGKPIRLIGTNRHQDYPWVGPALSDAANARDAMLIKKSGHNIVRLSHYPQSPAFLDACDRLGIMTIPCIPGWQFLNGDPRFVARVKQDIRELIRRDRNHPSAVWWEASLNETYPPTELANEWDATAKSESVDGRVLTAGDGSKGVHWDVVYNQWIDEGMQRPQTLIPDKPGYVREYGDYEFGGAYSTSRVRIGAGMTKLLQESWNQLWELNKLRPSYPSTMGLGTWEMFDSNVPWEFSISACGLADIMRREKPSFWFYESQSSVKPYLKIASTWQPGASKRDVVVFANCPSADLFVNGKRVAHAVASRGAYSDYGTAKPFDGSNTANLAHPPLVFRGVPFTAGKLTVVGSSGTSDSVFTAGVPYRIKVWIDDLGVKPTANDLVFVRAAVVDRAGNVIPDQERLLNFHVAVAGYLVGDAKVSTEMGIASNLVRTSARGGEVFIQVTSGDLSGEAKLACPNYRALDPLQDSSS